MVHAAGAVVVVDTTAIGHETVVSHDGVRDRAVLVETGLHQLHHVACAFHHIAISHVWECVPVIGDGAVGVVVATLCWAWWCWT
jgi:hypothetical protein